MHRRALLAGPSASLISVVLPTAAKAEVCLERRINPIGLGVD